MRRTEAGSTETESGTGFGSGTEAGTGSEAADNEGAETDAGTDAASGRCGLWRPGLVAAGVVAGTGALAWPYTVDDAYVLGRYARRIAGGLGYTMNDGPATDGVTGPLALLPALAGEWLAGDPVLASKLFGVVCAALAAFLVVSFARSARERWVTAAIVAGLPWIGIWSVAGLETGMATLTVTVVGICVSLPPSAASRDREGEVLARAVLVGVGAGALAWLRPELAPAVAVLLLLFARRVFRQAAITAWALALVGAASVVAFRVGMFGTPIPLSAQAKPPDLAHGAEYVARAALLVFGGAVPAVILAAREDPVRRGLSLVLLVHVVAVLLAGGDWMPGFRLFVPVLPLLAFVTAGPIAARFAPRHHAGTAPPTRRSGSRRRAAALLVVSIAIPSVAGALAIPEVRAAGDARDTDGADLADWLAERGGTVALVDVGYLAYRSRLAVIDLGGITDPRVGTRPGGHAAKELDPAFLAGLDPRFLVLHSAAPPRVRDGRLVALHGHPVERRVASWPWTGEHYRVARVVDYAPGYHYVVLERRDPDQFGLD